MNCIYCGAPLTPGAPTCEHCGRARAAYAPPEGFTMDPNSRLYYRREQHNANESVQWVTWFDPSTGTYKQVSYPAQSVQQTAPDPVPQPVEEPPAPAPQPAAAPVPAPAPEPPLFQPQPPQPKGQIPAGFVLDPASGLYYTTKPGKDSATGASGLWYTWFTPSTGAYRQSFQPSETAVKSNAPIHGQSVPEGEKKKVGVLPIVLPLIALLLGVGIAFFQAGGFAQFSGSASMEIPPGVPIVSTAPANVPQLQPAGEGSSVEATVALDKTTYLPGETIQVTVQGVTQQMMDDQAFIAIYRQADAHSEYMEYDYPQVGSDTLSLVAPSTPGSYEVRLYKEDYVYTDETFVTLASFVVEGRAPTNTITLNEELLGMLGVPNGELKAINGDTCRRSYLMYGDGMVADYSGSAARYPVTFWLIGSAEEIAKAMEMWAKESAGGHPVEGKNIWDDQFTISMIEAGGEGLQAIFGEQAILTPEAMSASFTVVSELRQVEREEQADYVYEYDIWEGEYQAGEYSIFATFYEKDGELQLLSAMIWMPG